MSDVKPDIKPAVPDSVPFLKNTAKLLVVLQQDFNAQVAEVLKDEAKDRGFDPASFEVDLSAGVWLPKPTGE